MLPDEDPEHLLQRMLDAYPLAYLVVLTNGREHTATICQAKSYIADEWAWHAPWLFTAKEHAAQLAARINKGLSDAR